MTTKRAASVDLSDRQLDFLRRLAFRRSNAAEDPPRLCWLAEQPRGLYLLIVPTLFSSYEGLATWHGSRVLAGLHTRDLITYGPDVVLDEAVARGKYYGPRHNGRPLRRGSTVALTPAGVQLLVGLGLIQEPA